MKQVLIRLLVIVMICSFWPLSAQHKLKKEQINKDISLMLPEDFILMSKSERINKYVSSNEPLVMYTSYDRNIDFGITLTNLGWAANDLELLMQFYVSGVRNLYNEVEFLQQEVKEINGREFIVLEFVSKVTDEDNVFGGPSATSKYTYIQYTLFNNQVLLFNFSAPARIKDQWQPTASTMMESIRIDD